MNEIPEELEAQPKTKSEHIYDYVKQQFPKNKPSPSEIKDIAKSHNVSKALVYKMLRKLESEGSYEIGEVSHIPKAKEPIIRISPEEPMTIEEETPEIPSELIEQPPSPFIKEEPIGIRPEAVLEGFKPKDVTYMFNLGFDKIAQFTQLEAWKLETEESTRLGEIWSPILNKYLPQIMPYTPEIVAVIVTSEIILPRIWIWREHKKEQEKAKEEKQKEAQKKQEDLTTPQPSQPKTEPSEQEIEEKKRSQKPDFLKKLG